MFLWPQKPSWTGKPQGLHSLCAEGSQSPALWGSPAPGQGHWAGTHPHLLGSTVTLQAKDREVRAAPATGMQQDMAGLLFSWNSILSAPRAGDGAPTCPAQSPGRADCRRADCRRASQRLLRALTHLQGWRQLWDTPTLPIAHPCLSPEHRDSPGDTSGSCSGTSQPSTSALLSPLQRARGCQAFHFFLFYLP